MVGRGQQGAPGGGARRDRRIDAPAEEGERDAAERKPADRGRRDPGTERREGRHRQHGAQRADRDARQTEADPAPYPPHVADEAQHGRAAAAPLHARGDCAAMPSNSARRSSAA